MHDTHEESTEHFFTAFTDLLVGVIFLFILLLMVFALNMKDATPPRIVTEDIRTDILREIAKRMQARGTPVTADLKGGLVRLPESLLFASGEWQLSEQGKLTVESLAQVLADLLPCAASASTPCPWFVQPVQIDSVLIEGHTDNRPFNGPGGIGNPELSAFRAISVYKAMTNAAPLLSNGIVNVDKQPLLGVSAYGETRPLDPLNLDPNRRIDVRLIMRAPGITNDTAHGAR